MRRCGSPSPGLALLFGLQALINMGVNVGLLPAKGMTLPFISAGGSSTLAVSLGMGMLLALTRRRADPERLKKPRLAPQRRRLRHDRTSQPLSNLPRNVMLAAGGTGGHLFPAYALAEELGRRGIVVDLVTDHRVDKYGTEFPGRQIYQVPSATLASKSPIAMAKTSYVLGRGFLVARKLLKKVRPSVVIGFGGYPTFPPMFAAGNLGIPTLLHEQNAVLGRANKMLAKRVTAIATSFERVKFLDAALMQARCASPAIPCVTP